MSSAARHSSCLILVAALALIAIGGCAKNGYGELGLVEVTGTVKLDGQPLSGAQVSFEGEDKRTAMGTTDQAGRYVLMYDSNTRGVTPGPKIVRFTSASSEVEGGGASEGAAPAADKIPAKFNKNSELKADVSSAKRVLDFDLKSTP